MVFYRAESKLFFLSKIFVQKLAFSPNFLISKLVFEQVFCAFLGCVCDLTVWKAVRSRYSVSKTLARPLRWLTLRLIVLTVWWRSDNLRGLNFWNVNLEKTLKNVFFSCFSSPWAAVPAFSTCVLAQLRACRHVNTRTLFLSLKTRGQEDGWMLFPAFDSSQLLRKPCDWQRAIELIFRIN